MRKRKTGSLERFCAFSAHLDFWAVSCYSTTENTEFLRRKISVSAPGPKVVDEAGSYRKIRRMLPRNSESSEK